MSVCHFAALNKGFVSLQFGTLFGTVDLRSKPEIENVAALKSRTNKRPEEWRKSASLLSSSTVWRCQLRLLHIQISDKLSLELRPGFEYGATAELYMSDRSATLANASLTHAIAAISRQHREASFQSPTQDARFRQLMAGIRRRNPAPQDAKQALLAEDLFQILKQIPGLGKNEAAEDRDRALIVAAEARHNEREIMNQTRH